jgi:purine-binding chemotaxis protein CheW
MGVGSTGGESRVELACLGLRGRTYGLEVHQVREIVSPSTLTPLPGAPGLIEGVMELRGDLVPVIDLGRALEGEPLSEQGRSRVVVVESEGLVFGLRVESAVEVLSLEAEHLASPPALALQAGYETVRAVVRRDGAPPVLVLSLEQVLEGVYRSARGAGGAT